MAFANSKAFASSFTRVLFANHFGTGNLREDPASVSSFLTSASSRRKAAYCSSSSLYDKNIDDQVCPTVVPDYAISDKYWGPHPVTGVFGPVDSGSVCSPGHFRLVPSSTSRSSTSSSVLDQTVWVRSLDDFEV